MIDFILEKDIFLPSQDLITEYGSFRFSASFSEIRKYYFLSSFPIATLIDKTNGMKLSIFNLQNAFVIPSFLLHFICPVTLLQTFALVPLGVWVKTICLKKCHLVFKSLQKCPKVNSLMSNLASSLTFVNLQSKAYSVKV